MSKTLSLMKKAYQVFAFLSVMFVISIFIFSADIPVYESEPFIDGNGVMWIKDQDEQHGYQVIESQRGVYQLKVFNMDSDKNLHTLIDTQLKIDLPLATPLTAKHFSSYNGNQVIFSAPLSLK